MNDDDLSVDMRAGFEDRAEVRHEGLRSIENEKADEQAAQNEKLQAQAQQFQKSLGPSAPSFAEFDYPAMMQAGIDPQYDASGNVLMPAMYYKSGAQPERSILDYGADIAKAIPHGIVQGQIETGEFIAKAGLGIARAQSMFPKALDATDKKVDTFFDETLQNPLPGPETVPGHLAGGFAQFFSLFGPASKAIQKAGMGPIKAGIVAGVPADMAAFDPEDGNLGNLFVELGEEHPEHAGLNNAFTQWLSVDEGDSDFEGRLKMALEGAGLGAAFEGLFAVARGIKKGVKEGTLGGAPSGSPGSQQGMVNFHGTPHKFNKFDLEKINSGEGTQMQGWGLYFAGREGTGQYYKEALSSGRDWDASFKDASGELFELDDVAPPAVKEAMDQFGFPSKAIPELRAKNHFDKGLDHNDEFMFTDEQLTEAADWLEQNQKSITYTKPGHLYEVDIPDEAIARMLHWDKPLKDQPESVQKTIREMDLQQGHNMGPIPDEATGKQIYRRLSNILQPTEGSLRVNTKIGEKKASELLNKNGIPGVKYYDGVSRAALQGNDAVYSVNGKRVKIKAGDIDGAVYSAAADGRLDQFLDDMYDLYDDYNMGIGQNEFSPHEMVDAANKLKGKTVKREDITHNIVVFDDQLPTILKRNGQPVGSGGGGKGSDPRWDADDVDRVNFPSEAPSPAELTRKSVGKDGRIAGAPAHVKTRRHEKKIIDNYLSEAGLGAGGRDWYKYAAERINKDVGNVSGSRPGAADQAAGVIGEFSPRATLEANRLAQVRATNQHATGQPVAAGMGPRNKAAQGILDKGKFSAEGALKVGPFSMQVRGMDVPRGVHDVRDLQAFGFDQKHSPSAANHRWMDKITDEMVVTANKTKLAGFDDWTHDKLQAARWVKHKADEMGVPVEKLFNEFGPADDFLKANVFSEAIPSGELVEFDKLSEAGKKAYTSRYQASLSNAEGQNALAHQLGLLSPEQAKFVGEWEGSANPNVVTTILADPGKGADVISAWSEEAIKFHGALQGLLGGQADVAYSFLRKPKRAGDINSGIIPFNKNVTPTDLASIAKNMRGLLKSADGGAGDVIVNYRGGKELEVTWLEPDDLDKASLAKARKAFRGALKEVSGGKGIETRNSGGLITWTGEFSPSEWMKYLKNPKLRTRIEKRLPTIAANIEKSMGDLPLTKDGREIYSRTIKLIKEGGLSAVESAVKSKQLPVAVIGALLAGTSLTPQQREPSQDQT